MSYRRFIFLILLTAFALAACEKNEPVHNSRFLAFGTLTDVSIVGVPRNKAIAAVESLEQDFTIMNHAWHAWAPGPLTRTNKLLAEGKRFALPPSVLVLMQKSAELAKQSDNLFNPAIGRLIRLWGFQRDTLGEWQPPDEKAVKELVNAHPSMDDIVIDGIHAQCSNPLVQLDFGAIGKGYGIDLAIEHLKEMGIRNAIVNSGGDLRAIGSRGGHPWRIAIRGASGSGILGFLYVSGDESVFTSGNYERNYLWKGRIYHHIIDPRSGYPARGTRSVTVIHDNATVADAAATALFVAGPRHWQRIARQMGIKYVLLVDENNIVHMNPAMAKRVHLMDRNQPVEISPPLTADSNKTSP
ncbi:FAD:protein FMN transferase [Thiolapillus brandeum]|uniref:FAD:protein FMN transferase n=1 Tax=Thiolapillus brandeum TaxID=1076588 RepID=A0A7U6GKW9_9GAMM|nr:FAD:protein FMN transferase [Thiolapillus brandeum]BAO45500.1 thiamine biosynthesis lipoprotein [Thiolapillus brandeum]